MKTIRISKSTIPFFVFLFLYQINFSQLLWERSYTAIDEARKVCTTSDGGFAVCGETTALGTIDMGVIRLDKDGNVVWSRAVGVGTTSDRPESVVEALDGGIVVVGRSGNNPFAVKLDSNGNVVWNRFFSTGGVQRFTDIVALPDSTYLCVGGGGSTSSWEAGFFKLNKNGTMALARTWDSDNYTCCVYNPQMYEIKKAADGNFFICGNRFTGSSGSGYLAKVTAGGSFLWQRRYSGIAHFFSVYECANGDILLSGRGYGSTSGVCYRVDSTGSIKWHKEIDSQSSGYCNSHGVVEDADGNVFMAAHTSSSKTAIIKMDSNGVMIGGKLITTMATSYDDDKEMNLVPTADGAYVFAKHNRVKKVTSSLAQNCNIGNETFFASQLSLSDFAYSNSKSSSSNVVTKTFISGNASSSSSLSCSVLICNLNATILSTSFYNGQAISCYGASDGALSVFSTGVNGGEDYVWSTGDTTQNISGQPAGNYSVVVTDDSSCADTATFTLAQPDSMLLLTTSVSNYNGFDVSCANGNDGVGLLSVSGGTPGYGVVWPSGDTTNLDSGLTAGTHTVVVTDANGCVDSVDITMTAPPALSINPTASSDYNGTPISCHGASDGSVMAAASGGLGSNYLYVWSTGDTSDVDSNLAAGVYTVYVTDSNNCTDSAAITLTQPDSLTATTSSTPDSGNCEGTATVAAVGGTSGYTYLWDSTANNQTSATASNLCQGTYCVEITDTNGCTFDTCITVTSFVGIGQSYNPTRLKVYPNPSAGTFQVQIKGVTTQSPFGYIVNDMFGRTVARGVMSNDEQLSLDLPAGTYSLQVPGLANEGVVKLVIQN